MKFQQILETEQCFVSEVEDFLKTRGLIHYQIFVKLFVKICLHKHILRGLGQKTTVFCPKMLNLPHIGTKVGKILDKWINGVGTHNTSICTKGIDKAWTIFTEHALTDSFDLRFSLTFLKDFKATLPLFAWPGGD